MSVLQNKRFRIGIGIGAVVLAAAAIGLGSYAAFSDVETGPGGQIQSGTLDLEVGTSGQTVLLNVSNIQPGWTQDVALTLTNVGTLPGVLSGSMVGTSADVTCTEPERVAEGVAANGACAGNLADQVNVALAPVGTTTYPTGSPVITSSPWPGTTIPAGQTVTYNLRFTFPNVADSINNRAQGDSLTVTSNFNLTQV